MYRETRWEHLRSVLLRGLLGYGIVTGMVTTLAWSWMENEPLLDVVPGTLLVFGVSGAILGELMWRREQAFKGR